MTKILMLLFITSLLGSCSLYEMDDSDDSREASETTDDNSEADDKSSVMDEDHLTFELQESDKQAQASPFNDETLQLLANQVSNNSADIGTAGEVTLDYSGVYLESEDDLYGVYLLTNRTNIDMINLQMVLNQETKGDKNSKILDSYRLYLGEPLFGVLKAYTAMPIYIELDQEKRSELDGLEFGESESEIDIVDITFETKADDDDGRTKENSEKTQALENDLTAAEEYNVGYHPAFIQGMKEEEEKRKRIESGDVPELKVHIPPSLKKEDPQGQLTELLNDEQVLTPARGYSNEGDISLFWTGITAGELESTVFLIGNRTGETLVDLEVTLNFSTSEGDVIFENEVVTLSEEDYGALEHDTLTPVMIDIPEESVSLFEDLLDSETESQPHTELVDDNLDEKEKE